MSLIMVDGHDNALVGLGQRLGKDGHEAFLIYDIAVVLDNLVQMGMEPDEAVEYFQFNIQGAYLGIHTPAFMSFSDAEEIRANIDQIQETLDSES